MTGLLQAIPALYRKIAYFLYALAIVVVTAVQVWYGAIPDTGPTPDWTVRALAVLAYIGIPLGLTAGVNVGPQDGPPPSPERAGLNIERGAVDTRALAILGVVLGTLALLLLLFNFEIGVR